MIELDSNGKRGNLHFDVLVICTGFTYEYPVKNNDVYEVTVRKNYLNVFSKKIDEA